MPQLFPKLNILIAYPYFKGKIPQTLKKHQSDINFILDSGAFTAWKQGKQIEVQKYINFVKSLDPQPWRYFMLDVIGNPEKTKENLKIMLAHGLSPVPIFTRGEKENELDEMYKVSDLVAIGGLVGTKKNNGFVKHIMDKVAGRKVHWLGFTESNFVGAYAPYSCDSSSWSGAIRYGRLAVYLRGGRFLILSRQNFFNKPCEDLKKVFDEYEEDITEFCKKDQWRNLSKNTQPFRRLMFKSFVKYSLDITKQFGTMYFLACATENDLEGLILAYNYWRNKYENCDDSQWRNGFNDTSLQLAE